MTYPSGPASVAISATHAVFHLPESEVVLYVHAAVSKCLRLGTLSVGTAWRALTGVPIQLYSCYVVDISMNIMYLLFRDGILYT